MSTISDMLNSSGSVSQRRLNVVRGVRWFREPIEKAWEMFPHEQHVRVRNWMKTWRNNECERSREDQHSTSGGRTRKENNASRPQALILTAKANFRLSRFSLAPPFPYLISDSFLHLLLSPIHHETLILSCQSNSRHPYHSYVNYLDH